MLFRALDLPRFAAVMLALCLALPAFAQDTPSSDAADAAADSRDDRPALQPGDRVIVVVPERDSATPFEASLDEFGEITLGVYGRVRLGGLSEREALDALRDHLSTYIRSTSGVRLTIESRGVLVFVTGQVGEPGRIAVPRGSDAWTAIQAAGGALDTADLSSVIVQHGEEETTLNVASFLTRRSPGPLPELQPGELVFVPADASLGVSESGAGRVLDDAALADKVFVLGAVNRPGAYDRTTSLTPVGALAMADGPREFAQISNARLITADGSFHIDLAALLLGEMDPNARFPADGGAILYVPFNQPGLVDPFIDGIEVIGELNTPTHLETPDPLPLFEVLALAGGPTTAADIRRIYHVRQDAGFTVALRYDMRRFVRHGGPLGTVMVHPGDVIYLRPDPGNPWEIVVGGISDVAVIGTAVLLAVTLNDTLSGE